MIPLYSATEPQPPRLGKLELVGAFELRSGDPAFGGISAARFGTDRLYLLSDRSTLFELAWPPDGVSPGVRERRSLITANGRPLDAEALVLGPGGEVLVGDEAEGRIHTFARGSVAAEGRPIRLPSAFARAGTRNQGLETLARLPDDSLLAVIEGTEENGTTHVAVTGEDGLRTLAYRAGEGFQVTDADVAGDWLLVLERRLSLLGGWQGRIVALPVAEVAAAGDEPLAGRELALIAGPILGENYEGLAARAAADGSIELIVVADSNFNAYQRTTLLELRWRP